jgi:outer membrane protein TolC
MKNILNAIFLLFFLFHFSDIHAKEAVTWEDCVREAIENNPELISAAEQLKQAEASRIITRSTALPQISSNLSRKRTGTVTKSRTSGPTTRTITDSYSYGVSASQLIFDGFKTSSDLSAASEEVKAAEYEYAVTSSNVRLSLKTAFVGLLRAQELVSITKEIAQRRKQNLDLVRLRYDAGREHEGSLLTAEADSAQADFEVEQARRNVTLARRELMTELGRSDFTSLVVAGDFNIEENDRNQPDFGQLTSLSPFLKELIAKKEAARYGVKSAEGEFFPQVYLSGSIGKSTSYWPPDGRQWSTGLSVSFPIFEGGSRVAGLSKARSELAQAVYNERSGQDSVFLTLEETWTDLQNSIDEISVQEKYLKAAEKRAKIANAQYSTGLISFDDWIIIEDDLASIKKSFLDSRANMLIAEANWIQAKGGILEDEQ